MAVLVFGALPIYKFISGRIAAYSAAKEKPRPLGEFSVSVLNRSNDLINVRSVGEFYVRTSHPPGVNALVSSGLIELDLTQGTNLEVPSNQRATARARIVNESRILPLLEQGDYITQVIFSASPRPISIEVLFRRDNFERGLEFVYQKHPGEDMGRRPDNNAPIRKKAKSSEPILEDPSSSAEPNLRTQARGTKPWLLLEGTSEGEDKYLRKALGTISHLATARITIVKSARDDTRNVHIIITYDNNTAFAESFNTPLKDASGIIMSTIIDGKRIKQ